MVATVGHRLSALYELAAFAERNLSAAFPTRNSALQTRLPDGQVRVVLRESDVAVFDCTRGESNEIARVAIADAERGEHLVPLSLVSHETVVVLPAAEALRRTIQLPTGAARNLREILKHELERHSPLDLEQVYFDHWVRIHDERASKLEVDLRIIKRSSIERAIAICRALGVEPTSVGIDGDPLPLDRAELPLNRVAIVRSMLRRWSVPALSVLVFVLAVGVMTAAFARKELALSMLDLRVTEAATKAARVQQLREEIASAKKRAAFLSGEKRNRMAVEVLSELTRTIPDGTWVYSFQLNGREVRIRGFSSSASALIGAFDKSGFFANAQFRAPLTQGPQTGVERFDLSLEVKGQEP
jgi:general secretion pathway protein L